MDRSQAHGHPVAASTCVPPASGTADTLPPVPANGGRRRLIRSVLFGVILTSVLIVIPILAAGGDLNNKPINLSKRAEVGMKSADASLKASADGQWVAAVWSRGYNNRPDTAHVGNIMLKSANVLTGWELQVNVYTATATKWAQQPRLAFRPQGQSQSQVAVVWVACQNQDEQCNTLQWTTCDIAPYPDRCQPAQSLYSEANANLSNPDLAYDGSGTLHFIWRKGTGSGNRGIFYRRQGSGAVLVPGSTENSFNPALAWSSGSGGRLHMVWYQYADDPDARLIRYSADRTLTDNAWDNSPQTWWKAALAWQFTGGINQPYIRPSIAAAGSNVYLAWDMYRFSDVYLEDRFHLVYEHSADNGTNWLDAGGGDGGAVPGTFFSDATSYRSPLDSIAEESALRPSIAMSGNLPALAWHLQEQVGSGGNSVYVIGYVSGVTASGAISWQIPVIITNDLNYDPFDGVPEDESANPRLAIWPGGRVHIAHLGLWGGNPYDETSDWDVYYRGAVITDTSTFPTPTRTPGPGTPTPKPRTPTPTPPFNPYDDVNRLRLPVIRR